MDPFQNQQAPVRRDEYGNPIRSDEYGLRVDEYGNPVRQTTDEYGQFGSAGTFGDAPVTGGTQQQQHYSTQPHHVGGVHHNRSSSSSSSEEDDGHGGRRKKGLKEKIKEKIPGMGPKHQDQSQSHVTSTITPGAGGTYSTHEPPRQEKGMMEKIKEKLPGHHPTP